MTISFKKIKFQDKDILFKWSNLKSVRKNSLNDKKINYADHIRWMKRYLCNDYKNFGKLVFVQKKPIGLVRIDKKKKDYFISYLIAPKYRKKGYASKAVELFICNLKNVKKITAIVKNNNKASIKIFEKLNFKLVSKTNKYHKFKYNAKNRKN